MKASREPHAGGRHHVVENPLPDAPGEPPGRIGEMPQDQQAERELGLGQRVRALAGPPLLGKQWPRQQRTLNNAPIWTSAPNPKFA
jgi:hypothetical protein